MKGRTHRLSHRGSRGRFAIAAAAAAAATLGPMAPALEATIWDAGFGNTFTWSQGGNWDTNIEPTASDNVFFPTPVPKSFNVISLSSGEVALSLVFQDNYELTGGDLTFGSAGTGNIVTVSSTDNFISSVLGGTVGLSKGGPGTLTVLGANTYTGGTTINAGTLRVSSNSNLGNAANAITFAGGVLATSASFTTSRSITINAANGTFAPAINTTTFTGVIGGVGTLIKQDVGAIHLTGANTYSGGTTINAGTVAVGADYNLGNASGGLSFTGGTLFTVGSFSTARAIAVGGTGAAINVLSGTSLTAAGSITGTAGLTKNGAGTLRLTANNTLGNVTVLTGRLIQSSGTSTASQWSVDGASMDFTGGSLSLSTHLFLGDDFNFSTLTHSAGTISIANSLFVGRGASSDGVYNLSGTAVLNVSSQSVAGGFGGGTFNQTGGVHNALNFMAGGNSPGTYNLSGGNLNVTGSAIVGNTNGSDGTFTHTGGTFHVTGTGMSVGQDAGTTGRYTLSAGTLTVDEALDVGPAGDGTMTQSGGLANIARLNLVSGPTSAISQYNLSGGTLIVTEQLNIASYGTQATFTQSGGIVSAALLQIGNSSSGAAGVYNLTSGNLAVTGSGHLGSAGTGTMTQTGGVATIGNGFTFGATNGASGYYVHSAGSLTVSAGRLRLGAVAGGSGAYTLSGTGVLSTVGTDVGYDGPGTFVQSGGTFTAAGDLTLANSLGPGKYTLSDGVLSVGNESIGAGPFWTNDATFVQTGGTHTAGTLTIAAAGGSSGHFQLSGGSLTVTGHSNIGTSSQPNAAGGTFTQTGGTASIGGDWSIAHTAPSDGSVIINGGSTSVGGSIYVGGRSSGAGGPGTLAVSAGTLSTAGMLKVYNTVNNAINLSGGSISADSLDTDGVPAHFNFTSGTLSLADALVIDSSGPLGNGPNISSGKRLNTTALSVGDTTSGVLGITGGGRVDSAPIPFDRVTLGGTPSVLGQVDVADTGSVWNVNGPYGNGSASTVRIGEEGNGALNITDGGVVNVIGAVAIAQQASSTSTLTVSNAGSALGISDSLFVGGEVNLAGGAGSLVVSDEGQVDVGQTLRVWHSAAALTVGADGLVAAGGLDIRGGVNTVGVGGRINVGGLGMTLGGTTGITLASDTTSPAVLALGGNLTYTGAGSAIISGGALAPAELPGILDLASGTRTFDVANGPNANDLIISARITSGGLAKIGSGTLLLSTPSDYTGPTIVNAGTVIAGFDDALPTATDLSVGGGATVDFAGFNQTVGSLAGAGIVILGPSGNPSTLTVGGSGAPTTFAGTVAGTGTLIKQGAGTLDVSGTLAHTGGLTVDSGRLLLTNTNSFTGGIALNGTTANFGILSVGFDDAMGDSGNSIAFAGGRLHVTGTFASNRPITLNLGNGTIDVDAGQNFTPIFAMSGSGGLNKAGLGTLSLGASASYQGSTTLLEGTIAIAGVSSDRIPAATVLTMAPGTSLNLNGNNQAIATLIGNGTINLGGATFTTGSGDSWTQFAGSINGSGALVKNGLGRLNLTGSSSFTSGLTVNAGEVSLLGSNTFGNNISIGASGIVSASSDAALGNSANLIKLGGTFLAVSSFTNNHAIDIANANPTIAVAEGMTLTQAADISGAPSLFGTFRKAGAGTLRLTAAASTTSPFVTVDAGAFSLASSATMTGVSQTITTMTGGVLELDNTATNNTNRIANSTAIALSGGTFRFLGLAGDESSETLGTLTTSPGASTVTIDAGSSGTANLTFATLTGGLFPHSTLNFAGADLGATEKIIITGRSAGFMGARYTVNGTDFANYHATNGVVAVSDYVSTFTTNANVRLTADASSPGTPTTIRTLSLDATSNAVKVTQGAALSLEGILKFGAQTASISGSTLSNSTSNYLYLYTSGGALTIASALNNGAGGTMALVKSGPGTAILTSTDSNHNLSGTIYLNDGTIQIGSDANLGANLANGNDLTFYGGTLATTGSTSFASARTLTFNINGGGINVASGTALTSSTSNQLVANSTTSFFNKAGAGTLVISGANNNYNAKVNVKEGTLQLDSTSALGNPSIVNTTTITLHPSSSLSLRSDGAYPVDFRSDVVVLNNTTLTPATITTSRITNPGTGTQGTYQLGNLRIGDSTLVTGGTDGRLQFNKTVVLEGDATFSTGRDLVLTGQVTGIGTLTKTGSANLVLGADANGTYNNPNDDGPADNKNNTYVGLTKISAGTLYLNKQQGTNAIMGDVELNGGTLVLLQPRQIADTAHMLLSAGVFDVNGKSDTVRDINNTGAEVRITNGGSLNVRDTIQAGGTFTIGNIPVESRGGPGGNPLAETVTGTYSTTGMNVSDGTTVVNPGGILEIGQSGLVFSGNSSPSITLHADPTLPGRAILNGNASFTGVAGTAQFTNGGTPPLAGTVDLGGFTRTFTVNQGSADVDMQLSNVRLINGGLRKDGNGTLRLTAESNYHLGTQLAGGTLEVAHPQALGTGPVSLTNSPTLSLKSDLAVATFGNDVTTGSGTFIIGPATPGGQTNTFQLGRLTVGNATVNVFGDPAGVLEFANIQLNGDASINATPQIKISGSITGPFGITKTSGTGTMTLSGALANQFTGTTTVQAGVLQLGKNLGVNAVGGSIIAQNGTVRWLQHDQVPDSNSITVLGGTSLVDLNGNSETVTTLNMTAGAVQTGTNGVLKLLGSLSTVGNPQTASFSGNLSLLATSHTLSVANGTAVTDLSMSATLSGHGSLTKAGAGTVAFDGVNNLAGGISVNEGVFGVSSAAALGIGPVILAGGTLRTNAAITGAARGVAVGSTISPTAAGTLDSAGFDSTLGSISGSGSLTKVGAGTVSTNSLETGNLTVSSGVLRVLPRSVTGVNTLARINGSLSINPSAGLDLSDRDLLVNYGTAPSPLADIFSAVVAGFGSTTGGITSSTSDGSQILALFDNALVAATEWNGQTIPINSIVGKYTFFGDANIDGQITGDDYTVIDANLNTTPTAGLEWISGDLNLDGLVTGDDYTVIDANLGSGGSNPLSPAALTSLSSFSNSPAARLSALPAAAVPEPASFTALIFAGAGVLATRRRRHR